MNDKCIMEFIITINPKDISTMESSNGKVTMIPFDGHVQSELFTGTILPGGVDVQITNAAGIRHMCARYMFEGTDQNGKKCHLFVDNNGYFEPNRDPSPFQTYPVFMTDSEALAKYLHQSRFRAEGHGSENGVIIKIFDVLKKD